MRTILVAALAVFAIPAFAQDPGTPTSVPTGDRPDGQPTPVGEPTPVSPPQQPNDPTSKPDETDPNSRVNTPAVPAGPSTADPAVKPDAPTPEIPNPAEDVRTYAGVGSNIAYAEMGVGEFGGSASLSFADNVSQLSADPSIGYFLWDNVELSGLVGIRHINLAGESSNQFSLLAEPSLHFPINDGLFFVLGGGVGVALLDTSASELDIGLAIAPRTGVQLLLGRSGLLNLGVRYAAVFSSAQTVGTLEGGQTVLAFQNSLDIQAGYTIMF